MPNDTSKPGSTPSPTPDPTPDPTPAPSPEQVRSELKKLARAQGLDPALAEADLDPEDQIPTELMDLLTEITGQLLARRGE